MAQLKDLTPGLVLLIHIPSEIFSLGRMIQLLGKAMKKNLSDIRPL